MPRFFFFKTAFFVFLPLWLVSAPLLAQTEGIVQEIEVQGNARIEVETVKAYITLKVGESYTAERASASLKSLFSTGLFSDVSIIREGGKVVVRVEESPVVNLVAFEGNDAISDEDMQQLVTIYPRSVYSQSKTLSARRGILRQYRRLGRFSASVEPKLIELGQNRVNLIFEIAEGEKTGILGINFIGNRAFSDSDLRGEIASSVAAWWKLLSVSDSYDPDRLNLDTELLRNFYTRRGYADFRVVSAVTELSRDAGGFLITFVVEEGERYRFGRTKFDLADASFKEKTLRKDIVYQEGALYDVIEVRETLENITRRMQENGYISAAIDPIFERRQDEARLDILWKISQGFRSYVERVEVRGNSFTKDRVVRREVLMVEGDAFDRAELARSERGLRGLGFFRNISIQAKPGSTPDRVVLEANVEEFPSGEISLGAGYSTSDGLVGDFTIRENNFLGKGQTLAIQVARSQIRTVAEISFTEPYFLGRRVRASAGVSYLDRNYQSSAGYDIRRVGGSVSLEFPVGEDAFLGGSYTLRNDDVYDVSPFASSSVQEVRGRSLRSILGYSYTLDKRNDLRETTEGWYASLGQDVAGAGGDVNFIRSRADFRFYRPVFESPTTRYIGAARLRFGHITGWGGDSVRINDRFYLGGTSFRGFEYAGIGARDFRNNSLGAIFYGILSAEVRIVIRELAQIGVRPSLFTELGYIEGSAEGDVNIDEQSGIRLGIDEHSGIRMSVGISLQWDSPIGRLQFDFSDALVKEPRDREENFRFSIGVPFF